MLLRFSLDRSNSLKSVIGSGIVKMVESYHPESQDPAIVRRAMLWTTVHCCIGIVCACVPVCWNVFTDCVASTLIFFCCVLTRHWKRFVFGKPRPVEDIELQPVGSNSSTTHVEPEPGMLPEIQGGIQEATEPDIQPETTHSEMQPEAQPMTQPQMQPQTTHSEMQPERQPEMQPEITHSEIQPEAPPQMQPEMKLDCCINCCLNILSCLYDCWAYPWDRCISAYLG
jgi:hypothetical protein